MEAKQVLVNLNANARQLCVLGMHFLQKKKIK